MRRYAAKNEQIHSQHTILLFPSPPCNFTFKQKAENIKDIVRTVTGINTSQC